MASENDLLKALIKQRKKGKYFNSPSFGNVNLDKEIKFAKRQVKYFNKAHEDASKLEDKMRYSKSIYFWESKLKELGVRK